MLLNQGFTKENIKKIYQYGRREGSFDDDAFDIKTKKILKKYTSDIISLIKTDINPLISEIQKQKKSKNWKTKEELEEKLDVLNRKKKDLYSTKIDIVVDYIKQSVDLNTFKFKLNKGEKEFNGKIKEFFFISKIEEKFIMKHVQNIFEKLYKTKQANRFLITSQLKNILDNKLDFYILRTDIIDFYEEIDTIELINKIKTDNLLSPDIKRVLENLLYTYLSVTKNKKGIPRGIGISPFLSELYMRDFDKEIRNKKEVIFYSRYVDDICLVCLKNYTTEEEKSINFVDFVSNKANKKGLSIHSDTKTKISEIGNIFDFDYLGYRFSKDGNKIKVSLSEKRLEKYKLRIKNIFSMYDDAILKFKKPSRELNELFIKRLKYLTSNVRLKKKGNNLRVGVYYNNQLITGIENSGLEKLDIYLIEQINKSSLSEKMKRKARRNAHLEGYKNRKFFVLVKNKKYKKTESKEKQDYIKRVITF